ncbi:MAG: hypothetical protein GEU98_15040 [Pseudonocardiaceae bacterium]|nr:hypothetical protein [Pseudonocardiaceae bacterium]
MVSHLPIRITFSLPDGWQAAPPDEVGASGVAFVALHPGSADGFTPNITIAGQFRDPELSMEAIADESVRRLEDETGTVQVRQRTDVGSEGAPGITQVLDIMATVDNRPLPLVQCQVHVSMHDIDDPSKRAVIELILTCKPTQLEDVFGDFQEFVRTVRPAEAEPAGAGGPAQ